jgi:hypothetical protein
MGETASVFEFLLGVEENITAEHTPESSDFIRGERREVGDGSGFNLSVFPIAFAEEDSGRGVTVGDGRDIHADIIASEVLANSHPKKPLYN